MWSLISLIGLENIPIGGSNLSEQRQNRILGVCRVSREEGRVLTVLWNKWELLQTGLGIGTRGSSDSFYWTIWRKEIYLLDSLEEKKRIHLIKT